MSALRHNQYQASTAAKTNESNIPAVHSHGFLSTSHINTVRFSLETLIWRRLSNSKLSAGPSTAGSSPGHAVELHCVWQDVYQHPQPPCARYWHCAPTLICSNQKCPHTLSGVAWKGKSFQVANKGSTEDEKVA